MIAWKLRKLKSYLCKPQELANQIIELGDDRIVNVLIKKLKHRNYWVRRNAISVLGYIGDNKAISPLMQILTNETDTWLYKEAAYALARMEEHQSIPIIVSDLRGENKELQIAAAEALGYFKSDVAVNALLEALDEQDRIVLWIVAKTLGHLRNPQAIRPLLTYVHDIHKSREVVALTENIIEQKSTEVLTEDLLSITQLKYLKEYYAVSGLGLNGEGYGFTGTTDLDCSKLKKLAVHELERRKIHNLS